MPASWHKMIFLVVCQFTLVSCETMLMNTSSVSPIAFISSNFLTMIRYFSTEITRDGRYRPPTALTLHPVSAIKNERERRRYRQSSPNVFLRANFKKKISTCGNLPFFNILHFTKKTKLVRTWEWKALYYLSLSLTLFKSAKEVTKCWYGPFGIFPSSTHTHS